jgi:hypothetical protein
MAQTYHGVVRDNVVILDGMDLPDGTRVELRVLASDAEPMQSSIPEAVRQEMLARGLVIEFKEPLPDEWFEEYTPIHVAGKPLSEIIIDERR